RPRRENWSSWRGRSSTSRSWGSRSSGRRGGGAGGLVGWGCRMRTASAGTAGGGGSGAGRPGPPGAALGGGARRWSGGGESRNRETGAVHACGHNAQIGMLIGAGLALKAVAPSLAGRVVLMAVPAEEYVELEERLGMRDAGALEFLGGKAEMLRLGAFDDV